MENRRRYIFKGFGDDGELMVQQYFTPREMFRICVIFRRIDIITRLQFIEIMEGNNFEIPNEIVRIIWNLNPSEFANMPLWLSDFIYGCWSSDFVEISLI